ncbi:MAG: PH domain-containing protein [Prevotellaceae bacterium]|nr:PH domain-containing protein [Prevotellaceae bacterium]
MKHTYYSKIDAWLIILITVAFGLPIIISTKYYVDLPGLIIMLLIYISSMAACFTTRYVINGDKLEVWVLCFKQSYDIRCMRSVSKTRTVLSSPAASLDRIRIAVAMTPQARYTDDLVISPKRKQEFIAELQQINPQIKSEL